MSIDVSKAKDGGIMKKVIKAGSGEGAAPGCVLEMNYTGTLEDGSVFDDSQGYPFKFTLGMGEVIKGWDEGLEGIQKGEICRLVIRGGYAYGEEGCEPDIGPNETLIFEITCKGIKAGVPGRATPSSAREKAAQDRAKKEEEAKKKEEEKLAKQKAKEEAALARLQKKMQQ